jgi:uncharacterized protein YdaU (DUF1376 family)
MPIHIGDYKRDTGHLRAAGHGAYLLLLFHHWSTGGLPTDDEQLSAIACMTRQEWKKAKPVIQKFFGPDWVHTRVVDDLETARISYEKRAAAGKEGGKARGSPKHCPSNASAIPKLPLTTNQIDRIGSAGASAFTEGSKALASSLWEALGFENPLAVPPEYAGTDWRAVDWERAGWTADLICAVARQHGRKPLSYLEKCFATEFAKRQAPLPVVEIKQAEKLTVNHGKSQFKPGVAEIARRQAEYFESQARGDLQGDPDAVLCLPAR